MLHTAELEQNDTAVFCQTHQFKAPAACTIIVSLHSPLVLY